VSVRRDDAGCVDDKQGALAHQNTKLQYKPYLDKEGNNLVG
jgi:hypothetical protein